MKRINEQSAIAASSCRRSYVKPCMTAYNISVAYMIAQSPGETIGIGEDIPIDASGRRSSSRYFQNRFDYSWQDGEDD